jgi:hypothetical protein
VVFLLLNKLNRALFKKSLWKLRFFYFLEKPNRLFSLFLKPSILSIILIVPLNSSLFLNTCPLATILPSSRVNISSGLHLEISIISGRVLCCVLLICTSASQDLEILCLKIKEFLTRIRKLLATVVFYEQKLNRPPPLGVASRYVVKAAASCRIRKHK